MSNAIFLTEDGHLGRAAAGSVAVGDEGTALLGCFTSILLRRAVISSSSSSDNNKSNNKNASDTGRPTDQPCYRVFSECYLDRRMRGEALLGDLPGNWHGVLNGKGSTELRGAAYMDWDTGEISHGGDLPGGPAGEGFSLGVAGEMVPRGSVRWRSLSGWELGMF